MISAVVLSMNNEDTLDACLKSVIASAPSDKEIIVVDGHSTDSTPSILAKYQGKIRVVHDEGVGLGFARNLGVKNASNDLVAFVDPDVVCEKNHFLKILTYFNNHPEIAALDTAGIHPHVGTKIQKLESLFWNTAETGISSQLSLRGWSISFRRNVFDDVGGFCRGGSDDNDFTYRLRSRGYKILHIKTGSWHVPRRTLLDLLKEMKCWARNGAYLYYRWGNTPIFRHDSKQRKLFRILKNARAAAIAAYASSPITGLKYLRKTKNIQLYIYFIVRQYAWLYGFFLGNLDILTKNGRITGNI